MPSVTASTCTSCAPLERRRISRRAVLKGAGAVTTVAVAAPGWGSAAFASNAANRVGDVVVNIFLRGGMDGLSIVAPLDEDGGASLLAAARPTINVDPATLLPIHENFGLHPVMLPLMGVFNAGQLAVLPTAGFPNGDRSHFAVQRKMDEGLDNGAVGSGWLARHLDNTPSAPPTGLRAVSLPNGQRSLSGSSVAVTLNSPDTFRVDGFRNNGMSGAMVRAALQDLYPVDAGKVVNARAHEALTALDVINNAPTSPPANGAVYPTGGRGRGLGRVLADVAELIRGDVGLEAVATEANFGWDLHDNFGNQVDGRQAQNLGALAEVLATFAQDLGENLNRVTVVLMTEFGRTFRENGGLGVDHGRASTMFVMGGGIRGGMYGEWPGLEAQNIDGNALRVTVDYRSVLADILQYRLATANMGAVLPGYVDTPDKRLNLAMPLTRSDRPTAASSRRPIRRRIRRSDRRPIGGVLVICTALRPTCAVMLDERSAAMLDFERAWWNHDEPRDQVIRARFQCSPEEYHAELTKVLDDPAAMDHDPLVVRRLKRLRLRARKARLDGIASTGAGEGAHA